MEKWQQEMLWLTIIYRMLECDEKIPLLTVCTDYSFAEEALNEMHKADFLEPKGEHWEVTNKGKELRKQMIAIYDQALKFEIFGTVHLAMGLGDDITDDEGGLLDHVYDPRFDPQMATGREEEFGTEDLRIAMMTFLNDEMIKTGDLKERLSPYRIVFIQKLAEGKLKNQNIWFDLVLGKFYSEVEEIVQSHFKWTDVADTEDEAEEIMKELYTVGMLEQRKRDGHECSGCHIPLAIFEMNAKDDDEELTTCPNPDCGADFNPSQLQSGEEFSCPQCESTVWKSQRVCTGCGAVLDFGLPPGSIQQQETTEEVDYHDGVVIWGGYYDYVPYGYYDPWDPYVNIAAFGICCAILL
jgi:predicted transcriptional regulator